MTLYGECLRDIDRAISHNYPDNVKYKLFARKARCLKYLGRDFADAEKKVYGVNFSPYILVH